jgi:hypothetical protein
MSDDAPQFIPPPSDAGACAAWYDATCKRLIASCQVPRLILTDPEARATVSQRQQARAEFIAEGLKWRAWPHLR